LSSDCPGGQNQHNASDSPTTRGPGLLVVVSGPSAVGKSTVCQRLRERLDARLSVSATTRAKSPGECDGQNYYFLTRQEFGRRIDADEFLEHAEYLGQLYGTPAEPVRQALAAGSDVLLEIEVQGGIQVARQMPEAVLVYLLPPQRQALTDRITGRARDDREEINRRLANAQQEIQLARESGKYQHFVVNDVLDEAVEQIVQIVEAHRDRAATPGRSGGANRGLHQP
jgi:guanylate kinase